MILQKKEQFLMTLVVACILWGRIHLGDGQRSQWQALGAYDSASQCEAAEQIEWKKWSPTDSNKSEWMGKTGTRFIPLNTVYEKIGGRAAPVLRTLQVSLSCSEGKNGIPPTPQIK